MVSPIRPYITKDEPFGPIDSGDIDAKDLVALSMLFEKHNWSYKNLRSRPSIIIGRRGSGKTHYLRSVFFDEQYSYSVEIRTPRVLGQVARTIQNMTNEVLFSEMVSELWETILWIGVCLEIRKYDILPSDDLNVIDAYLDRMHVRSTDTVEDALHNVANMLEKIMSQNNGSASDLLWGADRVTLDHAKTAVIRNLEVSKKTFAILLDSLDDFQLEIDSVSRSLQGLLKVVGSMNKPRDVVDIRFCLPSELYNRFVSLSSNPNKDFRRALRLQWTAGELILIGAQRLMFYLLLNYKEFSKRFSSLDLTKRADALTFLRAMLPERITNQAGYPEETISYILRHTQLLPRHFIILLNSIFKNPSVTAQLNLDPFPVSAERVIKGIRQMEDFMVGEIFVAFNLIYPTASETCRRCLPELGHQFTMGDLHRVFTRHGKAVFNSDSVFDFQRMLLEIGAVGKVIPGSDMYIKGNFEYTVSHQLPLSQDDELCVHPLFSGIFRGSDKQERPVYPYGSELDDEDYRDRFD